jgi:branched-chain amino acid transport system ATP-binding protein
MANPLLQVKNLCKRFGALAATDNLSLEIEDGELHAIIGPNGAGKTTLLAQLAGELAPTSGDILYAGERINRLPVHERCLRGIARTFQITSICKNFTVLENVMLAIQAHAGHSFSFWRSASSDRKLIDPAFAILDLVGLEQRASVISANISHGEQRQLELALALATKPRLLLLDEPMAGMGSEDSAQMVVLLEKLKKEYTIFLIEHDMDAVFSLADRISVLVYGNCIATGTPSGIRSNDVVKAAYLGDEETAHA